VRIETVLRHLVVWQWVLACLSIVFFQLEIDRLPFLLREYAAAEAVRPPTVADSAIGWLTLLWAIGSLVASTGVFALRRWARPLFLAMALLGCVLQALLEPSVTTGWSVAAETAAQVVVGVTLGVVYFSPVRGYFARPVR
jgi:acyl dehydratase